MEPRERGLTFTTPMVQAIEADEKTVTRRIVTGKCPYLVGDLIYVKETYAFARGWDAYPPRDVTHGATVWRGAQDDPTRENWVRGRWRSSRFMPRHLARIWLELLDIRAEHIQDIPVTDVALEGIRCLGHTTVTPLEAFRLLWDEINPQPERCFAGNPGVFRYEFRKVEHP